MFDATLTSTILLLALASTLLLAAMLYPSSLLKWLQRKRYQYEVTFSLYMLTSTEKFILSTLLYPCPIHRFPWHTPPSTSPSPLYLNHA